MPAKLSLLTQEIEESIENEFKEDLPLTSGFMIEVQRWKRKFSGCNIGSDLADLVNTIDKNFYPNIYAIFTLLLTLPVTSCSCERSFSALRRLKTWTRTSMDEDRLNGLALRHVHKDHPLITQLEPLEILKQWDGTLQRRIALAFEHEPQD